MNNELNSALIVDDRPKPFIICLFKSIPDSVLTILRNFGKVIIYGQAYINLPIETLEFDYFIIDLREEYHRFYCKRYVMKHLEKYYFILYRYFFENNNGIAFHNEITEFPNIQISKDEFDFLLVESPLPEPHCFLSLCRYCCMK